MPHTWRDHIATCGRDLCAVEGCFNHAEKPFPVGKREKWVCRDCYNSKRSRESAPANRDSQVVWALRKKGSAEYVHVGVNPVPWVLRTREQARRVAREIAGHGGHVIPLKIRLTVMVQEIPEACD